MKVLFGGHSIALPSWPRMTCREPVTGLAGRDDRTIVQRPNRAAEAGTDADRHCMSRHRRRCVEVMPSQRALRSAIGSIFRQRIKITVIRPTGQEDRTVRIGFGFIDAGINVPGRAARNRMADHFGSMHHPIQQILLWRQLVLHLGKYETITVFENQVISSIG
jgi:hypothetical protein